MDTLIIAFGHKARRGKDTAVQSILDARRSEYDVRRYAFADALKREVNKAAEEFGGMLGLFTAFADCLPSWVKYDTNPDMSDPLCPLGKQRTMLQWWGTEYRRAEDPYYWVKALIKTLNQDQPQVALISDMRFLNEFSWVKSTESNRTVRCERVGFADLVTSDGTAHTSETQLDNATYHYTIEVEDGDVEELKKDAVWVFDHIIEELTPKEDVAKFPNEELTEYAIDESKEETEARPA